MVHQLFLLTKPPLPGPTTFARLRAGHTSIRFDISYQLNFMTLAKYPESTRQLFGELSSQLSVLTTDNGSVLALAWRSFL